MPENAYVYVIFRLDGSPCYVGKGTGYRWLAHQSRSAHSKLVLRLFDQARALGRELPRVKIRENLSHEKACEIETALITAIGRRCDGGPLLNRTLGGEGLHGYAHTPETRSKISAALKGRTYSDVTLARMSASGQCPKPWAEGPITEKRREAIRAATFAYWARRRQSGGTARGPRSEDQKISIRASLRSYHEKRRGRGEPIKNSRTKVVIVGGRETNLAEACRTLGLPYDRIKTRIRRGMDPQAALEKG